MDTTLDFAFTIVYVLDVGVNFRLFYIEANFNYSDFFYITSIVLT